MLDVPLLRRSNLCCLISPNFSTNPRPRSVFVVETNPRSPGGVRFVVFFAANQRGSRQRHLELLQRPHSFLHSTLAYPLLAPFLCRQISQSSTRESLCHQSLCVTAIVTCTEVIPPRMPPSTIESKFEKRANLRSE
eukprot:GHVS01034137.1.p2 GENE.GHVS01034137.1~~GHVS01034137.1.p2  ORF type:complete len:136 (+),score=8.66 GHVS01034137.1:359-766(+)